MLVIPVPGKEILECLSGLRPSEKEFGDGVLARSVTKIPLTVSMYLFFSIF
jgi:hypothetical protein